jgi:hypothetical protein
VDNAGVDFDLSGYLGGWDGQNDNAILSLSFLGSAASPVQLGPVLANDRGDLSGLLFRELDGTIPMGTRALQVDIQMARTDGVFNDGYADNLSLTLRDNSLPVP